MWIHLGQDEPSNKLTQKQEVHSTKLCLQTLLSEEMKPPETSEVKYKKDTHRAILSVQYILLAYRT